MNITLRELIYDYAGGMRERAHAEGGDSRRIVGADPAAGSARHRRPASTALQKAGSLLGSAGIIVLDDTTCMVWLAENLLHFYRHESCGKCTPCREGDRLAATSSCGGSSAARAQMSDLDLLDERRQQHRRQDAVRVRRRRGDAGADDAEALPARVRGAHQRRALHAAGRLARAAAGGSALRRRRSRCSTSPTSTRCSSPRSS